MSNTKRNSKKRRISDSDSSFTSPKSAKRLKLCHPQTIHTIYKNTNIQNKIEMDQDDNTSLVNNNNNNKNQNQNQNQNNNNNKTNHNKKINNKKASRSKTKTNNINNNHFNGNQSEQKDQSPEPNGHRNNNNDLHLNGHSSFNKNKNKNNNINNNQYSKLLFSNDINIINNNNDDIDIDIDINNNINNNNKGNLVTTPMGFKLSQTEIMSMLLQYLQNSGYDQTVKCLKNECGINNKIENTQFMKQWILSGDWDKLIEFYNTFNINHDINNCSFLKTSISNKYYITSENLYYSKILILEQKLKYEN